MKYRLISAVTTDQPWLENLRRNVYQELFQLTWGGWDEERHLRHFSECIGRGHISIIEADGVRVGMVQILDQPDAVEVGEIQIQPSHQNRGIGTCVIRDVISAARDHRKTGRLSSRLKKEKASQPDQRIGFRLVTQSDTHSHMQCGPSE